MSSGPTYLALVGDIGGTTARLALADVSGTKPVISEIRDYPSRSYKSGSDVVRAYMADTGCKPDTAALAVAGCFIWASVLWNNRH